MDDSLSKSRQLYRASVAGAFWGLVFDLWASMCVGAASLLIGPIRSSIGMVWLTLHQLAGLAARYGREHFSLPNFVNSDSLIPLLLLASMLAGAILFVLRRLLVPVESDHARAAFRWALLGTMPRAWMGAAWLFFVVAPFLLPYLPRLDYLDDGSFFVPTFLGGILLPIAVYQREVLKPDRHPAWWRLRFPGFKSILIWLSLTLALILIRMVSHEFHGSAATFLAEEIFDAFADLLLALALLAGRSGVPLRSFLRTLQVMPLVRAWVQLRILFSAATLFLAFPIVLIQAINWYVTPNVQEASQAAGVLTPLAFRVLARIHFDDRQLGPAALLAGLIQLLAQGRLLILFDRDSSREALGLSVMTPIGTAL